MSLNIETLLSWDPTALATASDGLVADRRTLLDLQDEIDDAATPASWVGGAAADARLSHTRLRDRLNDQVAELSPVIEALDDASTRITTAQQDVQTSKAAVESAGFTVRVQGGQVSVDPPADADASFLEDFSAQVHATVIATALADAAAADADLTAVLTAANANQYDGGTGTLGDAALPADVRDLSDAELAQWLLEDPSRSDYLDVLTPAQRQALGVALADAAGEYDGLPGDGSSPFPGGDEDAAVLAEQLEAYGAHPEVATAFLGELGQEGLLNVNATLLATPLDHTNPYSAETKGALQNALGTVLAAGTQGVDTEPDGDADNVSQQWVDDLVALGQQRYPVGTEGNYEPHGFQLLSPLLRAEGHSTYLLVSAAEAMESYEREWSEENGRSPWEPQTNDFQIDFTHGQVEAVGEGEDATFTLPTGYDPFGGVFEGMSHNPEAGREFLHGANGENLDRVDFYLSERDWPQHDVLFNGDSPWPTSQQYLGDALVAATTVDPTAASPSILERAVEVGHDQDLVPELRRDFADMLGAYSPDVFSTYSNSEPPGGSFLPGGRDPSLAADLDEVQLDALIEQIGQDEQAGGALAGYAAQYAGLGYDHYLTHYTDEANYDEWGLDLQNGNFDYRWTAGAQAAEDGVNAPYASILNQLGTGYAEAAVASGLESDAAFNADNDGLWREGAYVFDYAVGELTGKVPFVGGLVEDAVTAGSGAVVENATTAGDIDTTAQVQTQIAEAWNTQENVATAVPEAAVYRLLPDDYLAPEFFDTNGERIPMSEWGPQQIEAWQVQRGAAGVEGTAGALAGDLTVQLGLR